MKSFVKKVYFNRSKEDNWDIQAEAVKQGFSNDDSLLYFGYEVEMEVEIKEDCKNKLLKINGVDVSDKNIII